MTTEGGSQDRRHLIHAGARISNPDNCAKDQSATIKPVPLDVVGGLPQRAIVRFPQAGSVSSQFTGRWLRQNRSFVSALPFGCDPPLEFGYHYSARVTSSARE